MMVPFLAQLKRGFNERFGATHNDVTEPHRTRFVLIVNTKEQKKNGMVWKLTFVQFVPRVFFAQRKNELIFIFQNLESFSSFDIFGENGRCVMKGREIEDSFTPPSAPVGMTEGWVWAAFVMEG